MENTRKLPEQMLVFLLLLKYLIVTKSSIRLTFKNDDDHNDDDIKACGCFCCFSIVKSCLTPTARQLPGPSIFPGVCSNSCPLSW